MWQELILHEVTNCSVASVTGTDNNEGLPIETAAIRDGCGDESRPACFYAALGVAGCCLMQGSLKVEKLLPQVQFTASAGTQQAQRDPSPVTQASGGANQHPHRRAFVLPQGCCGPAHHAACDDLVARQADRPPPHNNSISAAPPHGHSFTGE